MGSRTVGDEQRPQALLLVAPNVKERAAFWCTQPLVAVPRVIRCSEAIERERYHTWTVCAVDECVDAACARFFDDAFDRQNETGCTGDVIDEQELRLLCEAFGDC